MIEIDIPAGSSPEEAARLLLRTARRHDETVCGRFNGILMVAKTSLKPKAVWSQFYRDSWACMTPEQRAQAGL